MSRRRLELVAPRFSVSMMATRVPTATGTDVPTPRDGSSNARFGIVVSELVAIERSVVMPAARSAVTSFACSW
jgi:hypothetical protein